MRTVTVITSPGGFPYQWGRAADYAPRDGTTEFALVGNPITMHVISSTDTANLAQLISGITQRGMRTAFITHPYDFSDRTRYQRRAGQRAPYGL